MEEDWWAVKASVGNGGRDVFFINPRNYTRIIPTMPTRTEYVIQRYVKSPLLYNGKKFHFRCYTTMLANGSAFVYENGFILTAGLVKFLSL